MGNGANIVADNFLLTEPCYDPNDLVAKKLSHGCNLFVQDNDARLAFIAFIKSGTWVEKLNDEDTSQSIAEERTGIILSSPAPQPVPTGNSPFNKTKKKVADTNSSKDANGNNRNFADYEMPDNDDSAYDYVRERFGSSRNASSPALSAKKKAENSDRMAAIIETCFTVSQMKSMLLATIFPLFLESPEYAALIQQHTMDNNAPSSGALSRMESMNHQNDADLLRSALKPKAKQNSDNATMGSTAAAAASGTVANRPPPLHIAPAMTTLSAGHATEESEDKDEQGMVLGDDGHKHDERLADLFVARPRRLKDMVSSALKTVDTQELTLMLRAGNWFQDLIIAVEDLPLCVSLATAREERRGFPLVYVNKAFERVTGYDRQEIVGQNCRFLQSRRTEREQIAKLQYALQYAQPVKVALTNVRKDGDEFFNLLAMKPVFDTHGIYSYVIGVQYDTSYQNASLRELKMVNELLSLLPNVLK